MANKSALISLSLLFISIAFVSYVRSQDSSITRAALMDFYQSTNGPTNWLRRHNWGSGLSICQWDNIQCSNGTFILDVSANGLQGTIPVSIGDFAQNITGLMMVRNSLIGTIPDSIVALTNLQQLGLSQNMLGGDLPYGFENLKKLTLFWVSDNNLVGSIPVDLIDFFPQIKDCRLEGNEWCCPVPSWIPTQCGMGCNGTEMCIENAKYSKISLN